MEIQKLKDWSLNFQTPLVIAGPCSAETEEQVLRTGLAVAESPQVQLLRAGIWKPRTRPNNFEGVGASALPWMQKLKKATGLPVTTEVANAEHVELALKHDIDVLWIGARSTVNPFTVQEIADALKGHDIPVLVKNPINPDFGLWIGAVERIFNAGITRIGAIHRGFSYYGKSEYRNRPTWNIAIALKSEIPELPLICDPSHIGGRRELIAGISQKAMDLNYDGLMIETHERPDEAWSDARQQLSPAQLRSVLDKLNIRRPKSEDDIFVSKLESLREELDRIDSEIVERMAARMKVVEEIGDYKREKNVAVFQLERWREVFRTRPQWAAEQGLNPEVIQALYRLIHGESIRVQRSRLSRTAKED